MHKISFITLLLLLTTAGYALEPDVKAARQELNRQYMEAVKQGDFSRHYIELGLGDPSAAEMFAYDSYYYYNRTPNYTKADIWTGRFVQTYRQNHFQLPSFYASYYYGINHWLHVGALVTYTGSFDRIGNVATGERLPGYYDQLFSVMAAVRFQYFDRRIVGLYSGVALGLASDFNKYNKAKTDFYPAWQLTALGLRLGNKVYWNAELGFGMKGMISTGIGFRL